MFKHSLTMRGAGLGGDGVVCAFGDRNYSCKSLGTGRKKSLLCHSLCPYGSGRGERQWSHTGSFCHCQKIPSGTRSDHTVTNQRIFNSKLRTSLFIKCIPPTSLAKNFKPQNPNSLVTLAKKSL